MKERRLSRRHNITLQVTLHGPRDNPIGETIDISRHGLFVKTELVRKQGELVQLWIQLPDNIWLQLMAIAVRAGPGGKGMGLRLYMMGGKEKIHWERLLTNLEEGADPISHSDSSPVSETLDQRPRFFIRPRGKEQLNQFTERELRLGAMYFKTPMPRIFGEQIELLIIHPVTDNAFSITGHVIMSFKDGALSERGNGIYFDDPSGALAQRFKDFMVQEERFTGV